jgi:hypothetical protein
MLLFILLLILDVVGVGNYVAHLRCTARAWKRSLQCQAVRLIPTEADWLQDEAFTHRRIDNLTGVTSSARDKLRVARQIFHLRDSVKSIRPWRLYESPRTPQ